MYKSICSKSNEDSDEFLIKHHLRIACTLFPPLSSCLSHCSLEFYTFCLCGLNVRICYVILNVNMVLKK